MAEMQEKMETSRLTLFERYAVESAGKYVHEKTKITTIIKTSIHIVQHTN